MIERMVAWVRLWRHCLTHMHRMVSATWVEEVPANQGDYKRRHWIGCGDCDATFYGTKPAWVGKLWEKR